MAADSAHGACGLCVDIPMTSDKSADPAKRPQRILRAKGSGSPDVFAGRLPTDSSIASGRPPSLSYLAALPEAGPLRTIVLLI